MTSQYQCPLIESARILTIWGPADWEMTSEGEGRTDTNLRETAETEDWEKASGRIGGGQARGEGGLVGDQWENQRRVDDGRRRTGRRPVGGSEADGQGGEGGPAGGQWENQGWPREGGGLVANQWEGRQQTDERIR